MGHRDEAGAVAETQFAVEAFSVFVQAVRSAQPAWMTPRCPALRRAVATVWLICLLSLGLVLPNPTKHRWWAGVEEST